MYLTCFLRLVHNQNVYITIIVHFAFRKCMKNIDEMTLT